MQMHLGGIAIALLLITMLCFQERAIPRNCALGGPCCIASRILPGLAIALFAKSCVACSGKGNYRAIASSGILYRVFHPEDSQ